jgi:hypothetical protein
MTCQKDLMALGKPYPRTCQDCGLGPCKNIVATPVALQLAKDLDRVGAHLSAAELRRLYAVNGQLLDACKTIVEAFDALPPADPARYAVLHINAARAAIAKATGGEG